MLKQKATQAPEWYFLCIKKLPEGVGTAGSYATMIPKLSHAKQALVFLLAAGG